uniref:Uncharacterized protein n=1 Tax=Timema poppense TaxID=170557 RepID=A0A7R9DG79_TIMPO|nr:unnamed protein product [Timema poppensis]
MDRHNRWRLLSWKSRRPDLIEKFVKRLASADNRPSKFSMKDEPLFNPELLKRLNFSHVLKVFNPPISAAHPGESLVVRPLCRGDYDRGKLLLSLFFYACFLVRGIGRYVVQAQVQKSLL